MRSLRLDPEEQEEARYAAAYPSLRRFAFVLAGPDIDPEDLLHETLVRMLARGTSADIDHLEAFGRKTMVNVASNTRRSLGRRRRMVERLRAAPDVVEPAVVVGELGDLMSVAPLDRAILYLFVVEGRSHAEVGALVGLSEVATRARYSRTLKHLRVTTEEEARRGDC